MSKQREIDVVPEHFELDLGTEVALLKNSVADLQELIACLPLPGRDDLVSRAFGEEPVSFASPQVAKLSGTALRSCQSYRVWTNNDPAAAKDRTVNVDPVQPANGFPIGSNVTVFVAGPGAKGNAPPAGAPRDVLDGAGGSAGFSVPAGQSVYVHYQRTNTRHPAGIRVKITNSA